MLLASAAAFPATLHAQEEEAPAVGPVADAPPADDPFAGSVYDGDWLSVGIGAGLVPSYTGSDDYVFFPLPVVQGQLGGIGISPRPAGLALDFVPAPEEGVDIDLGLAVRLRNARADQIEDPVVELAGELDRAFEVGPTAGIGLSGVLNPYDSLSFNLDARWDVAGAHDGFVIDPSVTYFTPLSRGMAASISVGAEYADDDFNDYYFSVDAAQSLASGLPQFQADGGFNSLGVNLLLGVDFDGDLANGGLAGFAIAGYSRLLGDAKDTPYTSVRGSADQFLGGVGIGFTF